MPLYSISKYAADAKRDFKTIQKLLAPLHCEYEGNGTAKLYESSVAWPVILGVDQDSEGQPVSQAEATRRMTLAKERQIRVQTEVTSGERLHSDDVQEVFDEFTGDIAAIVKQRADALGKEAVSDILSKLRAASEKLCLTPSATE